ncbi:MAG: sulfite exporter TauE/SafE family protein [Vicinamibacterales bacterium]
MAVALGGVIGIALGLLGGGGSILTVPIFVYVLHFAAKDAIAMSLAVVGATSAIGVAGHWRAGNVNVRVGTVFGLVASVGTYGGARLAAHVSGAVQLAVFAVVMLLASAFMFRDRPAGEASDARPAAPLGAAALVGFSLGVGVLTGLVGVGGGFLIVPALVLLAVPMREAVGTSLAIIAVNCAVGFAGYLGHAAIDWSSVGLVTAGTAPGIALGVALHRRVPQPVLRRGFSVFLLVMAVFILYQNAGPAVAAWARGA